jgi:hypothetical protein
MNSNSPCSLAGRYDNPLPPRSLAPIDSSKIPAPGAKLFLQSLVFGPPPPPLTPWRVCPSPLWFRGDGHTRSRERGWWIPIPTRGHTSTLWYSMYVLFALSGPNRVVFGDNNFQIIKRPAFMKYVKCCSNFRDNDQQKLSQKWKN